MMEMRPQENNVWGTGSLRAWYKGEHHEAKPAREGAFLPRKARARVVPSNPGYSGYVRVLMGTHGCLWVLMVLLLCTLRVPSGYLRVPKGTLRVPKRTLYAPRVSRMRVPQGVVLVRAPAARLQKCMLNIFQISQYQDFG